MSMNLARPNFGGKEERRIDSFEGLVYQLTRAGAQTRLLSSIVMAPGCVAST